MNKRTLRAGDTVTVTRHVDLYFYSCPEGAASDRHFVPGDHLQVYSVESARSVTLKDKDGALAAGCSPSYLRRVSGAKLAKENDTPAPSPKGFIIPQDDATRKAAPVCRGGLDYFPGAIFLVAQHSLASNMKHNPDMGPGDDPHWARDKSSDHDDCIIRHTMERTSDPKYHLTARAWRALAALQEYCEKELGWAPGAASRFPEEK